MKNVAPKSTEAAFFKQPEALAAYTEYVRNIVTRYVDNPAIFSWELINEPRCERITSAVDTDNANLDSIADFDGLPAYDGVNNGHLRQSCMENAHCQRIAVFEGNEVVYRVRDVTECEAMLNASCPGSQSPDNYPGELEDYTTQSKVCDRTTGITSWVRTVSEHIKKLDKNHMVGVGGDGFFDDQPDSRDINHQGFFGENFRDVTKLRFIDYGTVHSYVKQLRRGLDPSNEQTYFFPDETYALEWLKQHDKVSLDLQKPLIVGELGVLSQPGLEEPNVARGDLEQAEVMSTLQKYLLDAKEASSIQGVLVWTIDVTPELGCPQYPFNPQTGSGGRYAICSRDKKKYKRLVLNFTQRMNAKGLQYGTVSATQVS